MLFLSVILVVAAFAASCDAYAYAPAPVGGIATNNLPLLPQRDLFARNDTNSSRVPGVYKLSDLYDYTNFFDKFSFVEVSTLQLPCTHRGFCHYANSSSEPHRHGPVHRR